MPPCELLQITQSATTQEKPVNQAGGAVITNERRIPVGAIDIGKLLVALVTTISKNQVPTPTIKNGLFMNYSHRNVDAASVVCGAICKPHLEYCTVTDRPDHTDHKCPQGCNF
jgi:hypothetical protein